MAKKNKPGAGRPTKKTPFTIQKIIDLTKAGKTKKQMAEILDVCQQTIDTWLSMDFELGVTVRELKAEADEMVEASLLKRSVGFERTFKTQKVSKDGDVVEVEETQYFPPDPTSMKFWLMNRQREKYAEKVDHTLSDPNGQPIKLIITDYREDKEDKDEHS